PLVPKPGTEVPVRRCDLAAWRLPHVPGLPRLELYWPPARRDAVLAELTAVLRRFGDRFRRHPDMPTEGERHGSRWVYRAFPPLDGPASAEEVRLGRAIFSLQGQGKVRRVPLPEWPLRARWLTLKTYPQESTWVRANGMRGTSVSYDQEGVVWQAEEV